MDREPDARPVGYLGSIGEGDLALASIVAVAAAGYASTADWNTAFATWGAASTNAQTYRVSGIAFLATGVGLPLQIAQIFAAVMVVTFAATTLDSSFRLQRYIVTEMAQTYNFKPLQNGTAATILCVVVALGLAVGADPKTGAGALKLWPVFGASTQLLASLSLLALSIFLAKLGRNFWVSFVPIVWVGIMTTWGMIERMKIYYNANNFLLFSVALVILVFSVWMAIEGIYAFSRLVSKQDRPTAMAGDD